MSALLQMIEERRGTLAIAHVQGEIDASNTAWLGGRLRGLLTNRSDALAVDLAETTYLDSAGIALLFELADELRLHQQKLVIVVPERSPIARMIKLTGLDATVPTYRDLDAALGQGAPPREPMQ
jgi:stage II sporulation protein AA (anti-sigma F factor antagonist)